MHKHNWEALVRFCRLNKNEKFFLKKIGLARRNEDDRSGARFAGYSHRSGRWASCIRRSEPRGGGGSGGGWTFLG